MDPAPGATFSTALFGDLKQIREERGVSLEQVYDHVRVQLPVLRDFEAGLLVDSGMFNPVYQRSLLRGYATVLSVPAAPLLDAYALALEGQYEAGSLARLIRGEISELPTGGTHPVGATASEDAEPTTAPPTNAAAVAKTSAAKTSATKTSASKTSAAKTSAAKPGGGVENKKTTRRPAQKPRRVVHIDSSRVDPSPVKLSQSAVGGGAQGSTLIVGPGMLRVLAIGIPFLIVIVVAAIVIWPRLSAPETTLDEIAATRIIPLETELPSPLDSTEQAPAPPSEEALETNAPAPAAATTPATPTPATTTPSPNAVPDLPSVLPDTLLLIVRAVTDKVDPIRVKTDLDIRRPYWIDQGRSMTFPFIETIRIERHIDRISFEVLGRPISASIGDTTAVITREMIIQQLL